MNLARTGTLLLAATFAFAGCFYDTDGEPKLIDAAVEDNGLGTPCADDTDCADLEAAACALNPMAPDDPGYCTIEDCVAEDCTGDYQCCDCSASSMVDGVFCASAEDASMVGAYGCTCE